MNPARWLPTLLLTLGITAQAQAAPNCALANSVDDGIYSALTAGQWDEYELDDASYNWAECRAARLNREMAQFPQLSARIDGLRKQYREMREMEGNLAKTRAGGGDLYSHAIPRMYPWIENQLQSLAALTRSPLGAQTGQRYRQIVARATADHAAYIAALRAYKPDPADLFLLVSSQGWKAAVDRYEALGRAIMTTLGSQGDAATALGYLILNNTTFDASEVQ